jgi:hypothetical protein
MKTVLGCVLLLAPTVLAQTIPQHRLVERLTEDLISLTFLPEMPEGSVVVDARELASKDRNRLKAVVRDQSPALDGIMLRFAAHVAEQYNESVIPWSLAYVLTSTLAGKSLPEGSVKLLAASIVSSLDNAFVCRKTSTPLRNSAQFRITVKTAYDTLLALGVSRPNVQIVIKNLIITGNLIVHPYEPLIRPQ